MLKQDFLVLNNAEIRISCFNNYSNDKVIKLCLESFCSINLIHFQLEQRNSNQSEMRFERNKLPRSIEQSRLAKIFNLTQAWLTTIEGSIEQAPEGK
jgi:hypothetical protein